jgi:hypothetical protein
MVFLDISVFLCLDCSFDCAGRRPAEKKEAVF